MKNIVLLLFILLYATTLQSQTANSRLVSLTHRKNAAFAKYQRAIAEFGSRAQKTVELQKEFEKASNELDKYREKISEGLPEMRDNNKRSFLQRVKDFFTGIWDKIFPSKNDVSSEPATENLTQQSTSEEVSDTTDNNSASPSAAVIHEKIQGKIKSISKFLSLQTVMIKENDAKEIVTMLGYNRNGSYSTAKMLSRFQKANRLSQTGQLDDSTREKLQENLKQMKEALQKWGKHHEFSNDTLPMDSMLEKASTFLKNTPSIQNKSGTPLSPKSLLDKLTFAESSHIHKYKNNFKVNRISGAIGFGQLMPFTAKELGVNPYDPEDNLKGGAKLLSSNFKFLSRYSKDSTELLSKGIAGYNCGPYRHAFKKYTWDEIVTSRKIPKESIHYTIKIKSALSLKLSKAEKDWASAKGELGMLVKNGYADELKKDGYL